MLGEAFDDCLCLSLASQFNLHCNFADKVRDALKKQELDLAEMQKAALEKTRLADEKLASVTKLEEENTNLKAALEKKNDLEAFLNGLAKKMFLMLEGTCPYPTDCKKLLHHATANSLLFCVCRILSEL